MTLESLLAGISGPEFDSEPTKALDPRARHVLGMLTRAARHGHGIVRFTGNQDPNWHPEPWLFLLRALYKAKLIEIVPDETEYPRSYDLEEIIRRPVSIRLTQPPREDPPAGEPWRAKRARLLPLLGRDQDWSCFYCQGQGDEAGDPFGKTWHLDHKHPELKGTDQEDGDLVLACEYCNVSKGARSAEEFLLIRRSPFR